MANVHLRKEVLKAFKSLHRTRQYVFEGDEKALAAARKEINDGFKANSHISESPKIEEMLGFSKAVEEELRTTIIQAQQTEPGKFVLRITPETTKLDNFPFNPDLEIPPAKRREMAKACREFKVDK